MTIEQISENAFRVLGLPPGASQDDIDAAARRMRLMADDPMDAVAPAWMPAIGRDRQTIEAAVSRLTHPDSRLIQRLWWFYTPADEAPALAAANRLIPIRPDHPEAAESPAIVRDRVIICTYHAMSANVRQRDWAIVEYVVVQIGLLAQSKRYAGWLLKTEIDGRFEKAAAPAEVVAALEALPRAFGRLCLDWVRDAVASDDGGFHPQMGEAILALHTTGDPETARLVREELEAILAVECQALRESMAEAWKTREKRRIRRACGRAQTRFKSRLRPLMDQLMDMYSGQEMDQRRVRWHCVSLFVYIADAYHACRDYHQCHLARRHAHALAGDKPGEPPAAPSKTGDAEKKVQRRSLFFVLILAACLVGARILVGPAVLPRGAGTGRYRYRRRYGEHYEWSASRSAPAPVSASVPAPPRRSPSSTTFHGSVPPPINPDHNPPPLAWPARAPPSPGNPR